MIMLKSQKLSLHTIQMAKYQTQDDVTAKILKLQMEGLL